jgi:hypothetical protein
MFEFAAQCREGRGKIKQSPIRSGGVPKTRRSVSGPLEGQATSSGFLQCAGIEFLRHLPNLKRLAYRSAAAAAWDSVQPVAEFWKEYDAKKAGAEK